MPELLFTLCIALVILYATWQIAKSFYNGIRAIVEAVLSLFRQSDWHKYLRGEYLPLERWRKQHAIYLQSKHWRKFSRHMRDKIRQCEVALCSSEDTEVHHLHYNSLGREKQSDVKVLCSTHHGQTHSNKTLVLKNGKKLKPFGR